MFDRTVQNTFDKPSKKALVDMYGAGQSAYHDGVPFNLNPNKTGACNYSLVASWENGWVDAAKEDGHVWNTRKDKVEVKSV